MRSSNMVRGNAPGPPIASETLLENEAASVLTTTVDGGSALTTATAAKRADASVRSRSRSPHPAAPQSAQSAAHRSAQVSPLSRPVRRPSDARDSSFELQSIPSPDHYSITDLASDDGHSEHGQAVPEPGTQSFRSRLAARWESSKGLLMVMLAMFFSAAMGATARLMQTGPNPMHTFQILFARQSVTSTLSMLYMWWKKTPDAPLGKRDVRPLLVARGVGGFFGVFGLYYSVKYLPLAEATVITFLAPALANWVCSVLLKEPYTRREQLAGVISLIGVVFIARPTSLLGLNHTDISKSTISANSTLAADTEPSVPHVPEVSQAQRLVAIGTALLGVCGASCAYTTIRWIGKRAHPLISVNYFSVWCTFVSLVALIVVPGISFRLPSDLREWLLLLSLGTFGIIMQFLLTAGLSRQKGSSATNMTYTQMIFVLLIDYAVWGTILTWASWIGAVLILGSQIWGIRGRGKEVQRVESTDQARQSDEEVGLVGNIPDDNDDDSDEEHERLQTESQVTNVEMRELRH